MLRSFQVVTILPVLVLLLGTSFSSATDADRTEWKADQPYQAKKSNPVTYDVDFSVVVTAPYQTKLLRVWLPLPGSDAGQEVEKGEITTFPAQVTPRIAREALFGNQFAYFEFALPQGAQIIRHRFKVKVWELHWAVEPNKVVSVTKWPESFTPYLRSEQAIVVDDRFRKFAREILPQSKGVARDLATVLTRVAESMKYDHADASLIASSEHALLKGRGHCSDYHGLCAAVGRAIGYPTRITYGINPFPKSSPSHCKLEVYLPPFGWISFDVSETQKLISDIQKSPDLSPEKKAELVDAATARLLGGFRDNTWFLVTKGTDYDLTPPAAKRVPVVRTIYAEADGVALPDPDPANPKKKEFAWMTVHKYTADRDVAYPFKDWKSLPRK